MHRRVYLKCHICQRIIHVGVFRVLGVLQLGFVSVVLDDLLVSRIFLRGDEGGVPVKAEGPVVVVVDCVLVRPQEGVLVFQNLGVRPEGESERNSSVHLSQNLNANIRVFLIHADLFEL